MREKVEVVDPDINRSDRRALNNLGYGWPILNFHHSGAPTTTDLFRADLLPLKLQRTILNRHSQRLFVTLIARRTRRRFFGGTHPRVILIRVRRCHSLLLLHVPRRLLLLLV